MKERTTRAAPPRSDLFEELWALIDAKVEERLAEALPTMGTVTGRDGGGVKIQFDDEDTARAVGFPRARGTDLRDGDRVPVFKTKGGQPFLGAPTDSSNDEAAVDGPQLRPRAIKKTHIETGAVERAAIGNQAVGPDELDAEINRKINDAATSSQLSNVDKKAGDAQSDANDAKRDAGDAQSTANDAKGDASDALGKIKNLQTQIDRLEKRIKDKK